MKKYAVGVCPDMFDNKVLIVDAEDEFKAMGKAVLSYGEELDIQDWDMDMSNLTFNDVDEAIDYFINGGVAVSKAVEIG